jgi:hypothetical protein
MKYESFAGIDIGRYGAISIIKSDNIEIFQIPNKGQYPKLLPDFVKILEIISKFPKNTLVAIEQQQGHKGEDITSIFTLARYYQSIIDAVEYARLDYKIVHPKTWKAAYKLDSIKIKSLIKMAYLFPNEYKKYITQNKTGSFDSKQDGLAESLLIADYGRRYLI